MASMTSLDVWESFALIYRTRSVSAAARALGVSQPAVSARLRRLEAEVGGPLFVRSRAGVTPTAMADALARRVGPPVEQLRSALARATPLAAGRVRVGGAADVMAARIVPALAPLIRDGLDIEVSTGLAGGLLAELAEGRLDLVVSSVRPGSHQSGDDPKTIRGLKATALVDEEFLLVAAPTVAQAVDPARLEADPADALATIPLAAYAADLPIIRRYWLTEFEQRPLQRVALVLPDLRGILRAVLAGVGASVLPRYLVDQPLADGALVRLHEPRVGPLNTLWLVTAGEPDDRAAAVQAHLLQHAGTWASM